MKYVKFWSNVYLLSDNCRFYAIFNENEERGKINCRCSLKYYLSVIMDYYSLHMLIVYLILTFVGAIILFCVILKITTRPFPHVYRSKNERFFKDLMTGEKKIFPCLSDKSSIHLSVIVPAFDEEVRLPPMLDECLEYLEARCQGNQNFQYEIIVVSDGSRDKTVLVASEYAKRISGNKIRVLDLEKNRGKGGAVRLGMLSARGALLLFADADGATKFSDLAKLEASLTQILNCDYQKTPEAASEKLGISIGSRAHLEDDAIASRSYFRTILMHGFHFLVWFFAVRGLRDTQCGFKLLTRQAARTCFESMHVERWAFDVELLYIAQRVNIPITEISVNWTEIDGSKVTPVWSWIQMGTDLGLIWLRYKIGAWKLISEKKK